MYKSPSHYNVQRGRRPSVNGSVGRWVGWLGGRGSGVTNIMTLVELKALV